MQRHLVKSKALITQGGDEGLGEMQSRRGSGHRAIVTGEDGLVAVAVVGLGVAVQVGRQGNLTGGLQHRCERQGLGCPRELDFGILVVLEDAFRIQHHGLPSYRQFHRKQAFFPAFRVANQALPSDGRGGAEGHLIVLFRLKTKHLDTRTRGLVELQTGADDLGLVEDQQGILRQKVADMFKLGFLYLIVFQHQKVGRITLGQRILGNAVVRQRIVISLNRNMSYFVHYRKFAQKYEIITYFCSSI